jgi:ABC-type transport system involved in multi-copper enzyme maturation permease subunit
MTWQNVAQKDVRDAVRARTLWVVAGLLLVAFVGYSVAHEFVGLSSFSSFLEGLAVLVGVSLPLVAILLGYKSVVRERTSGSLFLTLSVPHSRRDVILGKFLGRSAVLVVPTLVALAVAGVVGAVRYGSDGLLLYPWFLLVTALYGVAFVGIAMGLSMSTTVDRRITVGAVGVYILLVQFWDNLHSVTLLILHRFDFSVLQEMPDWALLFRLVKPTESYYRLLRAGFDIGQASRYVGDAPLYVDWWAGAVLLLAWCVVPMALGFRRFATADL